MHKIVFISSINYKQQQTWLKAINQLLPNDTILLSKQIDVSKLHEIDIAIVANPDPIDLGKYPKLIWVQSLWAGVEKLVAAFNTNKTPVKLVRLVDPHLAKTMAESVLAWTLYLQRNMPKYSKQQLAKKWHQLPAKLPNRSYKEFFVTGPTCAMNAYNGIGHCRADSSDAPVPFL